VVEKFPHHYKTGEIITWHGFSSTTTLLEVVKSFLTRSNAEGGTIFTINGTFSGRHINRYSAYQQEVEVLLPPCSRFEVLSVFQISSIWWIQLRQIPTLEKQLYLED